MRFEKLIWTVLAMWLASAASLWTAAPKASTGEPGEYQAADGGSTFPPPDRP